MLALWLPILLSTILVFLMSAVLHMALRYHQTDYARVPDEDRVREALRSVPPGNYHVPHANGMSELSNPEMVKKFEDGPVGLLTMRSSGSPSAMMNKSLMGWFVFCLWAAALVAYVTSRTLDSGTPYLQIFRVAGVTAFLIFAGSAPVESIWRGRKWSTTIKEMFDGLLYSLLTAGSFAGFWPE
jgi:hypothetical protein